MDIFLIKLLFFEILFKLSHNFQVKKAFFLEFIEFGIENAIDDIKHGTVFSLEVTEEIDLIKGLFKIKEIQKSNVTKNVFLIGIF